MENQTVIGTYADPALAHEHALVVLAMGLECRVDATSDGSYQLAVEPSAARAAGHEIELYESERPAPAPSAIPAEVENPAGVIWIVAWTILLVVSFIAQAEVPGYTEHFLNSSIGLVSRGEWWRPLTALFLHADGGHILSNIGGSWLFFPLLARRTGAPWALALAVLSGALGNGVVAWLNHPESFRSLGASSAVFGSLGALAALACADSGNHHPRRDLRTFALPLVAGIAVLGLFGGAGSPQVDVAGHICGFGAGVILGFAWQFLNSRFASRKARFSMGTSKPDPLL